MLLLPGWLLAQRPDPVHFSYHVKKLDNKKIEIYLTAKMDPDWHIYAQIQPEEAIAVPTRIVFNKNPLVKMTGNPKENGTKEKYEDQQAGIVQYQYGGTLDFIQEATLTAEVKTNVSGTITYQACTDEMCLPPKTISFNIAVSK